MRIEKLLKSQLYFMALLVSLSSCFELDEIPLEEVSDPDVSIPVISFFNSPDTIFLQNQVYLDIDFETNERVLGYEIYLGSTLIETSEGGQPRGFYLQTREYSDGFQKLSLTIYFKSNTGSIADQIDAEAVFVTYEKIVLIDNNSILEEPLIKGFEIKDGELVLIFEAYEGFGFEKWEILNDGRFRLGESYDQSDTSFVIPNYAGEAITVTLDLFAKSQKERASLSYSFDFGLTYEETEDSLRITWNEVPFNSFANMTIYNGEYYDEVLDDHYSMKSPEKSFPYFYQIQVRANNANSYNSEILDNYYIRSNRIHFQYDDTRYTFRNDSIITEFYPYLYTGIQGLHEAITYRIIKRPNDEYDSLVEIARKENVVFSEDYKKVYQLNNQTFTLLDTIYLEPIESFRYQDLLGHSSVRTIYPENGDKIGFLRADYSEIQVYDFITHSIVYEHSLDCDNYSNQNRSYDLRENNIYISKPRLFRGGQRKIIWDSSNPDLICFNFDYTIWYKEATTIRFLQSGTGRTQFHNLITNETFEFNFNPIISPEPFIEGDYLFGKSEDLFQIYDLNTMEVIYEFKNPDWCCGGFRAPQLKDGRLSVLGPHGSVYYTDL